MESYGISSSLSLNRNHRNSVSTQSDVRQKELRMAGKETNDLVVSSLLAKLPYAEGNRCFGL